MAQDSTQPFAFFFDSDCATKCSETLDEAFLRALKVADPKAITSTRVYRGGLLIASMCYKTSVITASPRGQMQAGGVTASDTSMTQDADMVAYATLVGDFVDSCLGRWTTCNPARFWEYVARHPLDVTFVPSLPSEFGQIMDKELRLHPRYIGAVMPDLGNPLHRKLLIDSMYKDAFVHRGNVVVRTEVGGEYYGRFEGADAFSRSGKLVLPYEEFEVAAPAVDCPSSLSARGLVTQMRMRRCMALGVHQKLMNELTGMRALSDLSKEFEWDLRQLPDAPDEVEVQARKLTDYLLNRAHSKGASKAAFFEDVLGIANHDWRFLQAQIVDRLSVADYSDVRIDEHGIRFTAILPIVGRNGATATIETGWIVRRGERASLVTAFPKRKDSGLEAGAVAPAVLTDNVTGQQRWEMLFDLAQGAGVSAAGECVPKPLVVQGVVVMDGLTGIARVVVESGRSAFSRWLRATGRGRKALPTGCEIISGYTDWSAERCAAYADAFAKVLRRNGIGCRVETNLT